MLKWARVVLDRLFVVVGALLFLQAPLLIQQYTTQLSGHADELRYQVQQLEKGAKESDKTLAAYIYKFTGNADPDFARQGQIMQELVSRWEEFQGSLDSLRQATVFSKPIVFLRSLNQDVLLNTWSRFEFGIAFTIEGGVYAAAGALIGYALFVTLAGALHKFFSFFSAKKTPLHEV